MKINAKKTVEIDVAEVRVYAKVSDCGSYELMDAQGQSVAAQIENYVPEFFPDEHYGDYLILHIDIETGQIKNWKKPTQKQLEDFIAKAKAKDD